MGYDVENSIVEQETLKEKEPLVEKTSQQEVKKENIVQIDAHRLDFSKPLTEDVKGESLAIETPCHVCYELGYTKMCTTTIPYFKELIIMSFTCEKCGARSTEVKTGG
jgi:zinc finger protein